MTDKVAELVDTSHRKTGQVLAQTVASANAAHRAGPIQVSLASETIPGHVQWTINRPFDTVLCHVGGDIQRLRISANAAKTLTVLPQQNSFWFIPAGTQYGAECTGSSVRYVEVCYDPEMFAWHHEASRSAPFKLGFSDPVAAQLIQGIVALPENGDDVSEIARATRINLLAQRMSYLTRGSGVSDHAGPSLTERQAADVLAFINDCLDRKLSLEALAAAAGLTVHQLLIAFAKRFGTTPAQYIIRQRVNLAAILLRCSKQRITSIAYASGFASHSHLSAAFKRQLGCSPRVYRTSA